MECRGIKQPATGEAWTPDCRNEITCLDHRVCQLHPWTHREVSSAEEKSNVKCTCSRKRTTRTCRYFIPRGWYRTDATSCGTKKKKNRPKVRRTLSDSSQRFQSHLGSWPSRNHGSSSGLRGTRIHRDPMLRTKRHPILTLF